MGKVRASAWEPMRSGGPARTPVLTSARPQQQRHTSANTASEPRPGSLRGTCVSVKGREEVSEIGSIRRMTGGETQEEEEEEGEKGEDDEATLRRTV
ncbi:hypothetical protein EYF80_052339 [Liparis tanakae]|uniref:Uncharacterized protein n=1 Tax=Liparis tanakae TaxID=230148 RepID=A0A4Z2F9F3_9TELE|nr:hypothetical protein EYF80_052339 [Liparis tanakae]